MQIVRSLWRRAKQTFQRLRFDIVARGVLDLPPYICRNDGVLIVSLVGHSQLIMYLVAIKSFLRQLDRGSVLVVNDGTLLATDIGLLRTHLVGVDIADAKDIRAPGLPHGGCWERLILIAGRSKGAYVIQLDSDTVTMAPVPEIRQQVADNLPFMLRGNPESALLPLSEAPLDPASHVLNVLEASLRQNPQRESRFYARGCAAFAGFPCGAPIEPLLNEFGEWQRQAIGERMYEWGTEQVASNYILANLDGVRLLPYERYMNHWDKPLGPDARLAHFIGTYRFEGGRYRAVVGNVIKSLRTPSA